MKKNMSDLHNRLKISIEEFSWEKEDDESTFETEEPEPGQLVYITNLENGLQMDGTELNDEIGPNEKKPAAYNRPAVLKPKSDKVRQTDCRVEI